MSITKVDEKLLWGRAAGLCSNPTCRDDLTELVSKGTYTIGEMAHIIARKEGGARGIEGGGSDSYSNLILLCPTCHKHVDKAPEGTYPEDLLHRWKSEVEELRTVKLGLKIRNDHYDLFEYAYNSFCFEKNAIFIREETWVFNSHYNSAMLGMLNRISHYSKYIAECVERSETNDLIEDLYSLLKDFDGESVIINNLCNKSRLLIDSINRVFNNGTYKNIINLARNLNAWLAEKAHGNDMFIYNENMKSALSDLLNGGSDNIFISIISNDSIEPNEQERMLYERSVYLIQNYT